ncbi:GNAT family N-acetyltransferase [Arthrobacter sp. EpRS71]|uniref:GNAT family N-acetyltransferase n=1 Tax=Arthrobacter sp. EpRS71 TaxID=1743141 RepID=UPI0007463ACA|nr:GNAT family N-acetyltransferase [Arthrobacter sp. EpRS71]KUM35590.1 GCN5 family acetyltransferase [Arthrobacter sp. EpRS71]
MTFVIRPAIEADVPGIVALDLAASRLSAATADAFAAKIGAAISDSARFVLVAEIQANVTTEGRSGVVGWAKTHHWNCPDGPAPSGHYLGGVTVLPEFRRRGVATKLTEARLRWIWERADRSWYVVNARNQASLALHSKWGFREVARGPRFHTVKFDGGEGVLLSAARPLA